MNRFGWGGAVAGPMPGGSEGPAGPDPREIAILLVVLAGALGLRVALGLGAPRTMGDTQHYLECARALTQAGVCPQPPDFPFLRSPGYPWFLAALGGVAGPVVYLAQALLDTCSVLLVWILGRSLIGPAVGLLSSAAYAISPFALSFSSTLQTEAPYTFLVLASFTLLSRGMALERAPRFLLGGLVTGLAILVRPGHQVVAGLLLLWALAGGRRGFRIRGAGAFAVGVALVVLPQAALMARAHPGFLGVANGTWFNVWLGNGPMAPRLYSTPAADVPALEVEIWRDSVPRISRSMADLSLSERERQWRDRTLAWVAAHPGEWLGVKARALVHTARPWVDRRVYSMPVVVASLAYTLLCVYGGVAGLLVGMMKEPRVDRRQGILFLLPLLAVVFMNLLFQPHIRFRAALADPLLLPWGVAFFTSIFTCIFTSWRLGRRLS